MVSTIPEGLRLRISAQADADKIAVETTVEDWQIHSVEEFILSGDGDREITLQVPDVNVDSIHATGTVASGESLLLVPSSTQQAAKPVNGVPTNRARKVFRAEPQEVSTRMAILITLRTIESASLNAPQQPDRP